MNEYKNIGKFLSDRDLSERERSLVLEYFSAKDGIVAIEILGNEIMIKFYMHLHNNISLRKELASFGIYSRVAIKTRNPFKRIINYLIENNKKNLGGKRIECCDLSN